MVSRAERGQIADWWWTIDRWLLSAFLMLMMLGVVLSFARAIGEFGAQLTRPTLNFFGPALGHGGPLLTSPCPETVKLCRQVGVFGTRRGPCGLDQCRHKPLVSFAAFATAAFTAALVVAWTEATPRGKMRRGGPLLDRRTDLGQDDLCRHPADTDDLFQTGAGVGIGRHQLVNALVEELNSFVECINMGQDLAQHEPMMLTHQPRERFHQLRNLPPQGTLGKICHLLGL